MRNKTRIIAVETSGRIGSVAAALSEQLLSEQSFTDKLRHAAELLPTIRRLCADQNWRPDDIEELYISVGPGSFTGIRIAATLAKTLAFAQNTRIVAVPSIEAHVLSADLAENQLALGIKYVAVVLEAGRKQIFSAVFERVSTKSRSADASLPGFRTVISQAVMTPAELLAQAPRPLFLIGEGINYHRDELSADQVTVLDNKYWQGRAGFVHRCGCLRARAGLFADAEQLEPMYLRRPEAVEKWEQLHGKH